MQAKTSDFEDLLLQPGLYPCRLCQIIDIGTQKSNFDPAGNAQLIWALEFPTVLHTFSQDKGPEPVTKYRWFGNSLGPKSKMKEAITGMLGRTVEKNFQLDTLIPTLCQVMVAVEPKTDGTGWKNKFLAFMPATPEMLATQFPMTLDHFVFDLDHFNPEVFNAIPKGIQDIITSSKEYAAAISSGRFAGMVPSVGGPAQPQFVGQQQPGGVPGYQQPPAAAPAWTPPAQPAAAPQWQPQQPATAPAPQLWTPPAAAPAPQWTPPGQPAQPSPYPQPAPYTPGQAGQLPWEQPGQQAAPAQPQFAGQPQQAPVANGPQNWMSGPPAPAGAPGVQLPPPGQPQFAGQPEQPKAKRGGKKIG